ncbi:hypothetical protein LCGC14_2169440 [marine sediment metagenome]|uniref:Uncharacterized protein n=1 Tax=marine sediment metagenome TaxID=412755 RepID=A0A0F9GLH1_9ZZZZ
MTKETQHTDTSTNEVNKQIDIDALSSKLGEFKHTWMRKMAQSFLGIQVFVDPRLEGMRYYICVSREMHDEILKQEQQPSGKSPTGD